MKNNNNVSLLTEELMQRLLTPTQAPCISLYMPTHRSHPENIQDVTKFRNLVKILEKSLLQKYPANEAQKYLAPFETLGNDDDFWNHTADGIAVFSAVDFMETVSLQGPVKELAIVADSFHTKPLREYLQSAGRYHVLALDLHKIHFFEGNRHSLVEIELSADIPKTISTALGDELTEKHTTVASYGGVGASMHHGHGGKKDEVDIDAERFFRVIANTIYENYSKPSGLPLVLAALPEHHNLFQKVNKNPLLLPNGIEVNPTAVSIDKLAEMAWSVVEPDYLLKKEQLVNQFQQAKADGLGSDEIKEVAVAAVEGRVDTLIVEADRIISQRITNLVTGNMQKKDLDNPKVDDLLDDMSELVTKMGGRVMVLPTENMPSDTGLAAIYRY